MTQSGEEDAIRTPQEQTLTCEKHCLPIELSCDDCEKVMCTECVKDEHRDHDWNTI